MKMDLVEGKIYDYKTLYNSLEGGSHGHYLPYRGDTVYAAFLSVVLNPEAPYVVLVGKSDSIQRAGNILVAQEASIPVFIKKSTDHWLYEGQFRSVRKFDDSTADEMGKAADRQDVAFAIELERIAQKTSNVPIYLEGACRQVTRSAYERSLEARGICLKHFGRRCYVCMISFEEEYGARGLGFIHVHHLIPVSMIGGLRATDPIQELRPVCPNCHAMLHAGGTLMTPEELREIYWSADSMAARHRRKLSK